MTDTLIFTPDDEPSRTVKPRIKKAQFGDGYAQRAPDGINHQLSVWTLTHDMRKAEDITYLTEFLDAQGGTAIFLWTPPNSPAPKRFVCEGGYDEVDNYGGIVKSLSFTLTEVP